MVLCVTVTLFTTVALAVAVVRALKAIEPKVAAAINVAGVWIAPLILLGTVAIIGSAYNAWFFLLPAARSIDGERNFGYVHYFDKRGSGMDAVVTIGESGKANTYWVSLRPRGGVVPA